MFERYKKIVKTYGGCRIVNVPEFKEKEKVYVLSESEMKWILKRMENK